VHPRLLHLRLCLGLNRRRRRLHGRHGWLKAGRQRRRLQRGALFGANNAGTEEQKTKADSQLGLHGITSHLDLGYSNLRAVRIAMEQA
jgi:hypothetical protein